MKHPPKPKLPSYGEFLAYLQHLGFTTTDRYEHGVICRHTPSGCWLAYQDRKPTDPMLQTELVSAHHHLTGRGIIEDLPFDDFLATFLPAKAS